MDTTLDRHEQRKLRTRNKLLDAAEQVFSTIGFETASVLDITEAANVSKRTFYLHFADKDELIEALAVRGFMELRAQVEAHEDQHQLGEEDDGFFGEGFYLVTLMIFEYAAAHPELMRIIFQEGGSFRLQAMTRTFMAQAWEDNIHRKCTYRAGAKVPLIIIANAMSGVVFQLLGWWATNPDQYTPHEMATFCVSIISERVQDNFIVQECPPDEN